MQDYTRRLKWILNRLVMDMIIQLGESRGYAHEALSMAN